MTITLQADPPAGLGIFLQPSGRRDLQPSIQFGCHLILGTMLTVGIWFRWELLFKILFELPEQGIPIDGKSGVTHFGIVTVDQNDPIIRAAFRKDQYVMASR